MNYKKLLSRLLIGTVFAGLGYLLYHFGVVNQLPGGLYSGWNNIVNWWAEIPQTTHNLLLFIVTIASVVVAGLTLFWMRANSKKPQLPTPAYPPTFPFDVYSSNVRSSNNIEKLKKDRLKQKLVLPHQPRFPQLQQEEFEKYFDNQLLLFLGRRGLGKARECIEALVRLAEKKGEEVTILVPKGDFDRPRAADIPSDFMPDNLVLFLNEMERPCVRQSKPDRVKDSKTRTFHERLTATIQWMREESKGRTWKVVLTATTEPKMLGDLNLKHPIFNEKDFTKIPLKVIDPEVRPAFVRCAANCAGLSLEVGVEDLIAEKSDGTPLGIIVPLIALGKNGQTEAIKPEDISRYAFHNPEDWNGEIYKNDIEPYEDSRAVFKALSGLKQLGIYPHQKIVVDLAVRLSNTTVLRWRKKAAANKALLHDLQAWIEVSDGEVLCHDAFLQGKADVKEILPQIMASLLVALKNREAFAKLLPLIPRIANSIAYDHGQVGEALKFLKTACHRSITNAPLSIAYAQLMENHGHPKKALSIIEKLILNGCRDSRALTMLGILQSRMGQNDDAIKSMQKGAVDTNDDYAWLNYGVIASKKGLYDEAYTALSNAITLNPLSAKAWYSRGVLQDRANEREEAEKDCVRAVELAPYDPTALNTLGVLYDRMGKHSDALSAFEKALENDDNDASIWLGYGRTLFSCGQDIEALVALTEVKDRVGNDHKLLSKLSVVYGKNGYYDLAVAEARKALLIQSDFIPAKLGLGWNLLKVDENNKEGLKIFAELSAVAETATDWHKLSSAYEAVGLFEEGVAAAKNAVKLAPSHLESKIWLARQLTNIPDAMQDAIDVFRDVAEQSKTAYHWYRLCSVLGQDRQREDAIKAAQEALKIDPEHIGAKRKLGINLLEIFGKSEESLRIQKEVAEETQTADDWAHLSVGFGQKDHIADAVNAANKALEIDPDHFGALQSLGRNLVATPGREEEGLRIQEELSDRFRTTKDWLYYSVGLGRKKKHGRAVEVLREILEREPDHTEAMRSLAFNLLGVSEGIEGIPKDIDEIIGLQEKVAEKDDTADDWYRFGVSLGVVREHERAIIVLRKALALHPYHFHATRSLSYNLRKRPGGDDHALEDLAEKARTADDWFCLGTEYLSVGRYAKGLSAVDNCLHIEPDHENALSTRAKLFGCMGEKKKAEAAWQRVDELKGVPGLTELGLKEAKAAVEDNPEAVDNWNKFAQANMYMGQAMDAIAYAETAVQRETGVGESVMGLVNELLDVEPKAVADFMLRLCKTDQDNDLFVHMRGIALRKSGDFKGAVKSLRHACDLNPHKANYWYGLGKGYEDINDTNEAGSAYENALKINPDYFKAQNSLDQLNMSEDP